MTSQLEMPDIDIDSTWAFLENKLNVIYSFNNSFKQLTSKDYMAAYTAIYNYCSSRENASSSEGIVLSGAQLYEKLKAYLNNQVEEINKTLIVKQDEELVIMYRNTWKDFMESSKYTHRVFDYLNRYWVKRQKEEEKDIYDIFSLNVVLWKTGVFDQLKNGLSNALITIINQERTHITLDCRDIELCVESYITMDKFINKGRLDIYTYYFEAPFLKSTQEFYLNESQTFLSDNTIDNYIEKVQTRIHQETARSDQYLHKSTTSKLRLICLDTLMKAKYKELLKHFIPLLKTENQKTLNTMYLLLSYNPILLKPFQDELEIYIKDSAFETLKNIQNIQQTDYKIYVTTLIETYKKFYTIVEKYFERDVSFLAALDKACRAFVNRNPLTEQDKKINSPEMFARYSDYLLKKASKLDHLQKNQTETILHDIITIFKYIEDKDVFQKYYCKLLARRLINTNAVSENLEANHISKLKQICGNEYTSKMQKMFSDIEISQTENQSFEQNFPKKKTVFSSLVLNYSAWPLKPSSNPDLKLPDIIKSYYENFNELYNTRHNGRKLHWLHNLCKGELKANCFKNSKTGYIFQVNTFQLAIFLHFNDHDILSIENFSKETEIDPNTIKSCVEHLADQGILVFNNENSIYSINKDYENKKTKIALNIPIKSETKRETDKDQTDINASVAEDRKLLTQAAIVRIMKQHKQLKHVQLMDQIITQLQNRFQPQVPEIKKNIEILIDREYIERSKEDKDLLIYIA